MTYDDLYPEISIADVLLVEHNLFCSYNGDAIKDGFAVFASELIALVQERREKKKTEAAGA